MPWPARLCSPCSAAAPHPCQLHSCLARLKAWAMKAFSFLYFELKTSSQVYLQGRLAQVGRLFWRPPNDAPGMQKAQAMARAAAEGSEPPGTAGLHTKQRFRKGQTCPDTSSTLICSSTKLFPIQTELKCSRLRKVLQSVCSGVNCLWR